MKEGHTLPLTCDTASDIQGDLVVLGSDLQSLNYNELSDSLPKFVGFELIVGKGIHWNQPSLQVHFNNVLSAYLVFIYQLIHAYTVSTNIYHENDRLCSPSFCICLSICLVIYLPICQFVNVFMHLSVCLLDCVIYLLIICLILFWCLFVCLSVCLFIWYGLLSATNPCQVNSEAQYSSRETRAHTNTAGTS